jgi:hypothetical protein
LLASGQGFALTNLWVFYGIIIVGAYAPILWEI